MPLATRELQNEYQRKRLAKRRAEWFEGKICTNCGSEENLELHHLDPETKISHNVWSWSQKRRDEELLKCVVLCEICHNKISSEQFKEWYSTPLENKKHGTSNTYNKHGCRCDLCKEYRSKRYRLTGG